MHKEIKGPPKRRDRFKRIVVDYSEANFHQNEAILKIMKEIKELLIKITEKK